MGSATEERNPATLNLDLLSTEDLIRRINLEDQRVSLSIEPALPALARAIDLIWQRLAAGGRCFYLGAGSSGRLGVMDAVECPPTFGVDPELVQGVIAGGYEACYRALEAGEDDPAGGRRDLESRQLGPRDAVIGLAASGTTPYTVGGLAYARSVGALTVGIACSRGMALSRQADVAIEVEVGPEVIAGSTRMKAGTVQKMILNMISTGTMVRLGHVYSNLMVNLRTHNEKLRRRAVRIVAAAAAAPEQAAKEAIEQTGQVKAAIVMLKLNCTPEAAGRLVRENPDLRQILGER